MGGSLSSGMHSIVRWWRQQKGGRGTYSFTVYMLRHLFKVNLGPINWIPPEFTTAQQMPFSFLYKQMVPIVPKHSLVAFVHLLYMQLLSTITVGLNYWTFFWHALLLIVLFINKWHTWHRKLLKVMLQVCVAMPARSILESLQ